MQIPIYGYFEAPKIEGWLMQLISDYYTQSLDEQDFPPMVFFSAELNWIFTTVWFPDERRKWEREFQW